MPSRHLARIMKALKRLLRRRKPNGSPEANLRRGRSRAEEYLTATAAYHH